MLSGSIRANSLPPLSPRPSDAVTAKLHESLHGMLLAEAERADLLARIGAGTDKIEVLQQAVAYQSDQLAQHKREIQVLMRGRQKLVNEVTELQAVCAKKQADLLSHQKAFADWNVDMNTMFEEHLAEINSLKATIASTTQQLQLVESALHGKVTELATVQAKYRRLEARYQALAQAYENKENENRALKAEVLRLSQMLTDKAKAERTDRAIASLTPATVVAAAVTSPVVGGGGARAVRALRRPPMAEIIGRMAATHELTLRALNL